MYDSSECSLDIASADTDVIIIGAGPVGLFAVFQCGLLGLSCHLVDNLDRVGGQCAELYPEKPIFDIPSRCRVTGQQLVDDLMDQVQPFSPGFHLQQQASSLRRLSDDRWQVGTSLGTTLRAPSVVIAAGAGAFVPRRPPLPDIEAFEGRSVLYAVRSVEQLMGKRVVIAGGGDSALDWVLNLHPVAAQLTLVHRRDEFRAAPASVSEMRYLVRRGVIRLRIGELKSLEANAGELTSVVIRQSNGDFESVGCDMLLPFFGLKTELGPIADWGLSLSRGLLKVDTATFETSEPGIFAIGDINTYPGKLKLILSGFHEAALMAQAAFRLARPRDKLVFRYTTSSTELQRRLGVGA
jgi:thioredoxin reductase (NADPH)